MSYRRYTSTAPKKPERQPITEPYNVFLDTVKPVLVITGAILLFLILVGLN